MITFSPRSVARNLLADLPERSRRVLVDRFGLGPKGRERTLDSIGREYGITRERVRQIESHSLTAVRQMPAYAEHADALEELKRALAGLGAVLAHDTILEEIPAPKEERKHLIFILTVGHHFADRREDNHFKMRWHVDEQIADQVERALVALHESPEVGRLTPEEEFLQIFAKKLKQEGVKARPNDVLLRWLKLSKRVAKNPLGEWGRADSPHVRIKNTRDFAYLTLKRHGSPMHFTEVAKGIERLFGKEAHPATTHNELIKDARFVLVGRGLYALSEWGYAHGVVREVIKEILKREGPLSKEDVVARVKRERYVKDATIAANLQSGSFERLSDGRYALK